jgi:IS5 family transposase
VQRITGELAGIAEQAIRDGAGCIDDNHLDTLWDAPSERRRRLTAVWTGVMPESGSRLVGLHGVDARPMRKGRLGKPDYEEFFR